MYRAYYTVLWDAKLARAFLSVLSHTQAVLPERSWELVASPFTGYGPTRTEHLAPANLGRWLAYGYHPDDISGFIAVTREALSSPNIATGGWHTDSFSFYI